MTSIITHTSLGRLKHCETVGRPSLGESVFRRTELLMAATYELGLELSRDLFLSKEGEENTQSSSRLYNLPLLMLSLEGIGLSILRECLLEKT